MVQIIYQDIHGKSKLINYNLKDGEIQDLYQNLASNENVPIDSFKLYLNGKLLTKVETITGNLKNGPIVPITMHHLLIGGKGGFGSMLRVIGAQIEKTTIKEARRDLSGRRLRDINAEKRFKEWVSKKDEKERKRKEKLEMMTQTPKIMFEDQNYCKNQEEIPQDVDKALKYGLKSAVQSPEKRKETFDKEIAVNKQVEEKYAAEEALIVAEKKEKLEAWRKQDGRKLVDWTAWRRNVEDEKAAKYVPLPLSLTGFGDGARPRYWTLKLRKAVKQWVDETAKKQLQFTEKIPASLAVYLESNKSLIDSKFQPLCDKLAAEKSTDSSVNQEKHETKIQFPFELLDEIKRSDQETADKLTKPKTFPSGLVDEDYENFLKHHNFVQSLAFNLQEITPMDYEDEIRGWGAELWRRKYGSPDPTIKPSTTPCTGCGAYLHCNDHSVPGYVPSEVFLKLEKSTLLKQICQRCEFLHSYNVSIDVTVPTELYPSIISEIAQKSGIVIIMVDMTDFPASIWPKIIQMVGKHRKIYVVGNKVDLLPKDSVGYLNRIESSLKQSIKESCGSDAQIRHFCLISAKTGFGVENLVTKLLNDDNGTRDIYLVGCTNVGKSTLFNVLLQSDLCANRKNDLIQRATTSLWPGTTLNLLRFPINQMRGWLLRLRRVRLKRHQLFKQKEKDLRLTMYRQTKNPRLAVLQDRVDTTFHENVPFSVESGHPLATKHVVPKPFDAAGYASKNFKFFFDTPGAVYKEQLLTLLTTEELIRTVPRETIVPRTFSLWPFQTLFVGGLGRIDVVHARSNILLTVFASHYLPIHVTFTEQAKSFYDTFLGSEMLGVPIGGPERLSKWPILIPSEIDVTGLGWRESCADIVLSSAGWISVTADTGVVLKAYTPEGRGIYVRQPSLLPFAVHMKGPKIIGTPCFEAGKTTIDEVGDDGYLVGEKKEFQRQIPQFKDDNTQQLKRST